MCLFSLRSTSSSSYTSPSSTPSTTPSPVVSPRRDNVSQSQPRSGTLVIGNSLLRDIDGKQIRGMRVICKRGGYIADVQDFLLAQNTQYHHLILHVGTNDADVSLETSDVLEEFRPLLEAAVARANVVCVSALRPHRPWLKLSMLDLSNWQRVRIANLLVMMTTFVTRTTPLVRRCSTRMVATWAAMVTAMDVDFTTDHTVLNFIFLLKISEKRRVSRKVFNYKKNRC